MNNIPEDQIRARLSAMGIGRYAGKEDQFWLEAERELKENQIRHEL